MPKLVVQIRILVFWYEIIVKQKYQDYRMTIFAAYNCQTVYKCVLNNANFVRTSHDVTQSLFVTIIVSIVVKLHDINY